jgi:cell division protease FtsH
MMNDMAKNVLLWVIIAVVLMSVFNGFGTRSVSSDKLKYSEFLSEVERGAVREVEIGGRTIEGQFYSGGRFTTYAPAPVSDSLVDKLRSKEVSIAGKEPEHQSL